MTTGDLLTCDIETLAYGGDGLARVDGQVVFVPETIPGERVRARVVQTKKRYARACLLDILDASPDRAPSCCRATDPATGARCRVPGCVYDHLAYPAEIRAKQSQIEGFLRRFTDDTDVFLPPFASPLSLHYRNKAVFHAQRDGGVLRIGYRREPSHAVLDLDACPLSCDAINRALPEARRALAETRLPGDFDLVFRHTDHDGAHWWIGGRPPPTSCPDLLTEASPAGPLRVPTNGFYQVNPAVGDALVRDVAHAFHESSRCTDVLDLYCGVGVFGFACMAAGGTRLTGVESGRNAVAAARLNAAALRVPGTFHCRELGVGGGALADLVPAPERTTAIVDPPRDGMAAPMARWLAQSGLARIFYVSCDPATLARDLGVLLADGAYRLVRVRLFDMFPRTAHFETLVELTRIPNCQRDPALISCGHLVGL